MTLREVCIRRRGKDPKTVVTSAAKKFAESKGRPQEGDAILEKKARTQ